MYDYYKYDQNKFFLIGVVLDFLEGFFFLMIGFVIIFFFVQFLFLVFIICVSVFVFILVLGMVVVLLLVIILLQFVSKSCIMGYNSLEEVMKVMNFQSFEELVDVIKGSL